MGTSSQRRELACRVAMVAAVGLMAPATRAEPTPPRPEPTTLTEDLRPLWQQSRHALARGDNQAARAALAALFDKAPRWDVAANLGAVELQLGEPHAALKHLRYASSRVPGTMLPEGRVWLEAKLQAAEQAVAANPAPVVVAEPKTEKFYSTGESLLLFSGAVVSVAAFGMGLGFNFASQSRRDQTDARIQALGSVGGSDPCLAEPVLCDEISRGEDAVDALNGAAAGAYAGFLLVVGGVILYANLAGEEVTTTARVLPVLRIAATPGVPTETSIGVQVPW